VSGIPDSAWCVTRRNRSEPSIKNWGGFAVDERIPVHGGSLRLRSTLVDGRRACPWRQGTPAPKVHDLRIVSTRLRRPVGTFTTSTNFSVTAIASVTPARDFRFRLRVRRGGRNKAVAGSRSNSVTAGIGGERGRCSPANNLRGRRGRQQLEVGKAKHHRMSRPFFFPNTEVAGI